MKYIWNWIDGKDMTVERKYTLCLWVVGALLAAAGAVLYAVLNLAARLDAEWLLILTGWPVLISWVGIFLYGCRHPFHSGK